MLPLPEIKIASLSNALFNSVHKIKHQNDDLDRNGIPDIIEETPVLSGMLTDPMGYIDDEGNIYPITSVVFENKNWSNCYFPKDLSFYKFYNTDLSYSDFSDAKLFNTMFDTSNLLGADFSNTQPSRFSVFFVRSIIRKF